MKNILKKWKISLVYMLLPILLYGILGPLEIYAGNSDEMVFILKDFFIFFLIMSIIIWLMGSFILALLPDKLRNILHVVIFIFSVLSYIQNLFLNTKLMNLNGSAMDWDSMHGTMVSNLVIWLVLIGLFTVIPFVWKNHYQKVYLGIMAFISAVQFVTIISLLIVTVPIRYSGRTPSPEGEFETASGNNIIVLSFDTCYNTQFEETMEMHPEIAETLKDFTYYNNADCHYTYTFPSVAHMLTGVEYNCDISPSEWRDSCWHEERSMNFYNTLHALDYECDLYVFGFMRNEIGPFENLTDIFDNTIETVPVINHRLLYTEMEKMTIYKYVPYILKPRFEVMDYVIYEMAFWDANDIPYENSEFYQILKEDGLSVNESINNKFSYIHLLGLHEPRHTSADGTYSEAETSLSETSEGIAVIMQEYVKQLQNLEGDIYDNATIIITGDHGIDISTAQPIFFIKPPHTSQEEMQITSAPISHDDFQATVLTCIGQNTDGYGTSVFDWKDGDLRTREYWDQAEGGFSVYTYHTDRYELMSETDSVYQPVSQTSGGDWRFGLDKN